MNDTDKYISCVSHDVKIYNEKSGQHITIRPSGVVVRSSSAHINERVENGIPISEIVYGKIRGLPAQRPGIRLIVSAVCVPRILEEYPGRTDLYSVDSTVRCSRTGEVLGCKGLIHWLQ